MDSSKAHFKDGVRLRKVEMWLPVEFVAFHMSTDIFSACVFCLFKHDINHGTVSGTLPGFHN